MMIIERNKEWYWPWAIGAGILVIAGGLALVFLRQNAPELEPVADEPQPAVTAPAATSSAVVATPPPSARTIPLPPLDESDADVMGGLTEFFGPSAVMQHLVPERVVRNIVVTIDNIPRQQMALNQRPIQPTPGPFVTAGSEDAIVLAPENYARYEPFVALVSNIDAKTLVSFYRGLEPLFQQAYEELGQPDASFSTRLTEVIEHLLQTPTPRGQIALVQPSVLYRYADERLEKLSSGQKLLIRMGVDNAGVVKGKLREIQAELQ
jgi:Protein of unknown function (DUF3014)